MLLLTLFSTQAQSGTVCQVQNYWKKLRQFSKLTSELTSVPVHTHTRTHQFPAIFVATIFVPFTLTFCYGASISSVYARFFRMLTNLSILALVCFHETAAFFFFYKVQLTWNMSALLSCSANECFVETKLWSEITTGVTKLIILDVSLAIDKSKNSLN